MIKTEASYKRTVENVKKQEDLIESETRRFREMGLTDEQVTLALQPLESFREQLKDDIVEYERAIAGKFEELTDLRHMGKTLIALRLYKGISQAELAESMNVAQAQVSRDESNEYYGSRVEKLMSVLEAMNAKVTLKIEL